MLGIIRYRNAPGKRRSADREIAQAATHERNHFVGPCLWTDEVWVGIKFEQLILKSRQLEEIILFLHGLGRPSAVRTGSARFCTIDIELVGDAILSGVSAFVDVTVVANAAKQFLHALLMPVFCGADEVVVGDTHALPQFTELRGNLVGILLWSFTSGLCRPLALLPVFVCAGEKELVRAQHALPPRNAVTRNRCIGMSYVRTSVHVINRRRNVELPAHSVPSAQLTPVPTISESAFSAALAALISLLCDTRFLSPIGLRLATGPFQVSLDRLAHHILQRHAMLDCNSTAVLVFRSVIGDRPIHARNLDPHFAPGRVNALPLPRQRLSPLISPPDAQRGGFGKDYLCQSCSVLRLGENRQQCPR